MVGYDGVYKALCYPFGEEKPISIAYVSGSPGVYSSEHAVKLNYFHIIQPTMFLSIAGHEAANFFIIKLLRELKSPSEKENSWADKYKGVEANGLIKQLKKVTFNFPKPLKNKFRDDSQEISLIANVNEGEGNDDIYDGYNLHDHPEYEVFLFHLREDLFQYFIVDLNTLYYSYNGNLELFYFWHWNYFLQLSECYKSPEEIDLNAFIIMFMRIGIVAEFVEKRFMDEKMFAPSTPLQKLWNHYYMPGTSFFKAFLDIPHVKEWFNYFQGIAKKVVLVAHEEKWSTDADLDVKLSGIKEKIESDEKKIREYWDNNIIYPYRSKPLKKLTETQNLTKTQYVSRIIYAYLSQTYDMATEQNKKDTFLLPRNPKTGVVEINPGDGWLSNLLFDPLGGIFTHDPKVRRRYYRLRSILIKSIWDMSLIEKKELFLNHLRKE